MKKKFGEIATFIEDLLNQHQSVTHGRLIEIIQKIHLRQAYRLMREAIQSSNETFLQIEGDTPQNRRLISSTPVGQEAARLCQVMLSDVSTVNDASSGSEGDDEGEADANENSEPASAPQSTARKSRARKRRRPSETRPQLSRSPYPSRNRRQAASFESPLEQIPLWRRENWHRRKYAKPTNLLPEIEQVAETTSTSNEAEASSSSDIRPVGLNRNDLPASAAPPSSSSSSALEMNPNVSNGDTDDTCDREVRDILNMSTLEAVAGSSHSEVEEGQIVSSDDDQSEHEAVDDDTRYDLDSPPFHMVDADDETVLQDMPHILFCGRCSAPNSIRHIYTKFDEQWENDRLEAEAAIEAARRQQQQQQHQLDEAEVNDIPPNYSALFPATMPAPRTPRAAIPLVPQNTPMAASTPIEAEVITPEQLDEALRYVAVGPPQHGYTPRQGAAGGHGQLFLSPSDHFGTPANNRTENCFLQDDDMAAAQNEKEEGEVSSSAEEDWCVCSEPSLCEKWAVVLRNVKIEKPATTARILFPIFC